MDGHLVRHRSAKSAHTLMAGWKELPGELGIGLKDHLGDGDVFLVWFFCGRMRYLMDGLAHAISYNRVLLSLTMKASRSMGTGMMTGEQTSSQYFVCVECWNHGRGEKKENLFRLDSQFAAAFWKES
ncbi:hypothetical protein ACMYSQ_009339 [Aspergillus niger]